MPSVAIVGASKNRGKFGNKAVRAFAKKGYVVYPVHPTENEIEGIRAYASVTQIPVSQLDMVSMYVPAEVGMDVFEEVAKKNVVEVWLNPGAESPELLKKGERLGLNVIAACSIVGIGMQPSEF